MIIDKKKIVLVGTGMVGMSFAYAALNESLCNELVLIDIDKKRAMGEAMDLNHGLAFAGSNMKIYQGEYADCNDADICVLCAGVNQQVGETRLALLNRNVDVFRSIVEPIVKSGFKGIFIIATNPVDIMTRVCYELSGFDARHVLGTGTTLDTARLKYIVGDYFSVDPRNVHGYVIGEHGDSEFVPWSQTMIATKSVLSICEQSGGEACFKELERIADDVLHSAAKIIEAKKATYYGIGMAIIRIVKAILNNENSILTVSSRMDNQYGETGVFAGMPCVINGNGVERIIDLDLTSEEVAKFKHSCSILNEYFDGIKI